METILSANKLELTYLKIYSKESGIFSKSTNYFAELYKQNKLCRKYDIDVKYIGQFISTYQGLFDIANRPWPTFNESEKAKLRDFLNSGFLSKMVGSFLGGLMLKYSETTNRITVISNRNQFNLQLVNGIGSYSYKADASFARIDPDFYNINDCNVSLEKSQVEFFLACIGYKFLLGLMPGLMHHVSSNKIYTDSIYDIALSLPTEWLSSVATNVINHRFLP